MSNKEFRDASTGEPVLDLKMTWEATSGRTVMSGKDAAGEEILRFKSKTVLIKARLKTTFVNRLSGSDEEVVLNTAGGFTGKKDARIELGDTGRAVAIIRRASTWSAGAWLLINGQVCLCEGALVGPWSDERSVLPVSRLGGTRRRPGPHYRLLQCV